MCGDFFDVVALSDLLRTFYRSVTAPLSLIITAYATVVDIRKTWTPDLKRVADPDTVLVLIDLGLGKKRLGGSVLAQVYSQVGDSVPNLDDVAALGAFFKAMQRLREPKSDGTNVVLAYHDRSDGGMLAAVAEMCFAGRCGAEVVLHKEDAPLETLFNEELGAIVQVRRSDVSLLQKTLLAEGFPADRHATVIASVLPSSMDFSIRVADHGQLYRADVPTMHQTWAETSYRIQALRDNQECARQEFDRIVDRADPGMHYKLTFDATKSAAQVSPYMDLALTKRPAVAILREQGVNGHLEMANAFFKAGFKAVDVHMSDLLTGRVSLDTFTGMP